MNDFLSASRHPRLSALCTIFLAAQLVACGGDDGGSTATPPPSGNAPTTPPLVTRVKLTLQGTVTDSPIANASVTATVGSETFTATADANGNYSLDIEIAAANTSRFVTLAARGAGEQSFVEFTSLAGSFQSLLTQAGDGILLSSENFATQITNVSTAEAVLLKDANGGQPITSDALLASLGTSLNGQQVLDLATAIKLVVDDSANYSLPAGQTSVLALISDTAARQQFVDNVYAQNPATFALTQTAITADPGLSKPLSVQSVPTALTAAILSSDPGFSFNYSNRVAAYTFAADGTGSVSTGSFHEPMTWTVDGSNIKVAYRRPVSILSYDTENCAGDVRQVEAHYVSSGVTLTLLSARTLATTETSKITYGDCPALAAREVTATTASTILADSDFQTIDVAELRGATQTIYVYDAEQDAVVGEVATIGADGTGTTRFTNKSFTWSADAAARLITANFNDGTVGKYRTLRSIDEVTSDLFYEITTPNARYVDAGATVYADPAMAQGITADRVPGRYYQFGIGLEGIDTDPRLKSFRLRFDAAGTGSHEDDYLDNLGNLVTVNEMSEPYYAFRWTIDGSDVVVRRTFNHLNGIANCVYGTADCTLADERRIVPLAMEGNRIYWLESRKADFGGVTAATRRTGLVRYYDYEPLTGSATYDSAKTNAATNTETNFAVAKPATVRTRASLLRGPQQR